MIPHTTRKPSPKWSSYPLPGVPAGPFWGQEWWGPTFGLRLDLGRAGLGHIDDLLALGIVQGFLQDAGASLHARLSTTTPPALKFVLAVSWKKGDGHQSQA